MLGGRISHQDEDEVEDELEALAAEVTGVPSPVAPLPDVPVADLPQQQNTRPSRVQDEQRVAALA